MRPPDHREYEAPSYVDGPCWQGVFDALFDLVSFSHMYDLFVRRWPLVLMKLDCRGPNHCDGFGP
jgi:hypothetical protein